MTALNSLETYKALGGCVNFSQQVYDETGICMCCGCIELGATVHRLISRKLAAVPFSLCQLHW